MQAGQHKPGKSSLPAPSAFSSVDPTQDPDDPFYSPTSTLDRSLGGSLRYVS